MARKDRIGNRKTREQRKQFKVPELGYYLIVTDTEATERCFFTGLHQALPEDVRNNLVECLIWNVPDSIITKYSTWNETVKQSILYIYDNIDRGDHTEWGEVSERLYLFRGRKWSAVDVMKFMDKAWGYLGYAE